MMVSDILFTLAFRQLQAVRGLATNARHRGAVDMIAVSFGAACYRFWRSSSALPAVRALPKEWLDGVLAEIRAATPESVTRRSAGYPQVLTCIISTAPLSADRTPHSCVGKAIAELVALAENGELDGY